MKLMDCHCHIDVDGVLRDPQEFYQAIISDSRSNVKYFFNLMSTNHLDLQFLEGLLEIDQHHVIIPYFGVHPWYAHLFSVEENTSKSSHYQKVLSNVSEELLCGLPDPLSLTAHLDRIRGLIRKCEQEDRLYGIGEIGLDKIFRIPTNGYFGNPFTTEANVSLTSAKTSMDHQIAVFEKCLQLAEEFEAPVSLHCVKAHGPFFDIVSKSYLGIPGMVFHSYTGSSEQAKRWLTITRKQKRKLFFSFSNIINGLPEKEESFRDLITILGPDQLLIETDMAADRYFLSDSRNDYFEALESVRSKICSLKHWEQQEGIENLEKNYAQLHR